MPRITSLTQADQEALFLEFVQEIHAGFRSPAADCAGERIDIARELTSPPQAVRKHHFFNVLQRIEPLLRLHLSPFKSI